MKPQVENQVKLESNSQDGNWVKLKTKDRNCDVTAYKMFLLSNFDFYHYFFFKSINETKNPTAQLLLIQLQTINTTVTFLISLWKRFVLEFSDSNVRKWIVTCISTWNRLSISRCGGMYCIVYSLEVTALNIVTIISLNYCIYHNSLLHCSLLLGLMHRHVLSLSLW